MSVDRDEYAALVALKNSVEESTVKSDLERTQIVNRNHDLRATCSAQARRLVEVDMLVQSYERVIGLQRVFIDLLRADHPAVASLEDLSTFWRQWVASTENTVLREPRSRDEVSRLEPDLFRSWKVWVRDAGRASRQFALAGTRAEVEVTQSLPQGTMQDRTVDQLRAEFAIQLARVRELEAEVEAYPSARKGKP